MSLKKNIKKRTKRRAMHVRSRLRRDSDLPRVSVFRSLKQVYVQVINDAQHATVVSCSSRDITTKGSKTEVATAVGVELAKKALEKGIKRAKFDRGSALYHGRVKAVADGLREGGLQI